MYTKVFKLHPYLKKIFLVFCWIPVLALVLFCWLPARSWLRVWSWFPVLILTTFDD